MWMLLLGAGIGVVAVVAAGWGLWMHLKHAAQYYFEIEQDGNITDSEKIAFADDVLDAIDEAKHEWDLVQRLAIAIASIRK